MADRQGHLDPRHSLDHEVWGQLQETIRAATGWPTVLLRAELLTASEPEIFATPEESAILANPALHAAVRDHLARCQAGIILAPGADGVGRRWIAVPVVINDQGIGVVLAGGLPPAESGATGPSMEASDAERALGLLGRLVESVTRLYTAMPAPAPGLANRYLAARRRADALYQLSTLMTSTLEIDPLVELLVTQTRQLFGADRAAVYLQQGGDELRCVNAVGLSPEYLAAVNAMYARSVGGNVRETGVTRYVADVARDPVMGPLREAAMREGFRSMVVTPFMHRGAPIGALALYHDQVHEYDAEDLAGLSTFANHVAVAFVNARLFEDASRQLRRSNFLAEAGRLLNSTLDMNQVLDSLSRAVTNVLGEGCAIYLLHKNEEHLALTAYADASYDSLRDRAVFLSDNPPRLGEPGIGQAALRGEVLLVDPEHPLPDGAGDLYQTGLGAHSYLAVPLQAQDRLVGALVIWLFNPALRFVEEEIKLTEALADHAASALENARLYERELRSQQAKDEFLSSVSHELRTPLTAILGYTQLIRKMAPPGNTKFSQQLNIIWSQAQRLNRLVETILDISNIEQGQLDLQLERMNLWEAVGSALERLRASARPGLAFDVQAGVVECWVMGDRHRLEQVFGHLLANAMKYSPAEGIVRVEMENPDSRATVRIIDSGPGMTEGQMHQLFQRYYQGETPLNRSGGLGLGLYISRSILEAHGGTITAQSSPGGGSAFQVTMPAESSLEGTASAGR